MASSFTGNMRLSYSSGKPDPMARDEIGKGRADAGRSSKIASFDDVIKAHPSLGFVRTYGVGGRRERGRYRRAQGVAKVDDLVPTSNRALAEYLSVPDDAVLEGATQAEPKAISLTDRATRYTAAAQSRMI
jgi:hypothetical protein